MTDRPVGALDGRMEALAIGPRVIIAVQPRLLADTLRRAVINAGADVVIDVDAQTKVHADVAVVMGETPAHIDADTVIRLPATEDSQTGSITTAKGTEPAALADLAALLQTLNHFLRPV